MVYFKIWRIWLLTLAGEYEKSKEIKLENSVLIKEILLCDTFLKKDDRNFHCWNYRSNIFDLIQRFFPECFVKFLQKEFDFTLSMIKTNFSNFSAWHYRSKLFPLILKNSNISWNSPGIFEFLKEDLEYIKNAFYTDHKDQSPWNYHFWILNNVTPVYVTLSFNWLNLHFKDWKTSNNLK